MNNGELADYDDIEPESDWDVEQESDWDVDDIEPEFDWDVEPKPKSDWDVDDVEPESDWEVDNIRRTRIWIGCWTKIKLGSWIWIW